ASAVALLKKPPRRYVESESDRRREPLPIDPKPISISEARSDSAKGDGDNPDQPEFLRPSSIEMLEPSSNSQRQDSSSQLLLEATNVCMHYYINWYQPRFQFVTESLQVIPAKAADEIRSAFDHLAAASISAVNTDSGLPAPSDGMPTALLN